MCEPETGCDSGQAERLRSHVYDDVPDSCQLKILNPEVCLLQSTAVWHVLSVSSVSRLGEQPLQSSEDVFVCALPGSGVLRAAVQTRRRGH